MADRLIPIRPSDDIGSGLTKTEKDMLVALSVFGYAKTIIFGWFNPQYLNSKGEMNEAGKQRCRQFFSHPRNIEWLEKYEATVKEYIGCSDSASAKGSSEITEERKNAALSRFTHNVLDNVETGENLDADTLKTQAELLKKTGLMKEDIDAPLPPIRFLPSRCFSECRYRLFVETAVKGGDIIDECAYCEALAYAKERGYRDDEAHRLKIPQEILDKEPENNVDLIKDIINKPKEK